MAVKASLPLTSLSEAQRTQAHERFVLLRPALERQITQTQLARDLHLSLSTIQRWIKQYREQGLAGLANARRSDKGKSRHLPAEAITLIEGLALQTPARSMAAIHRQVTTIAQEQGWKPPSYDRVRQIIKNLDSALVTMAHQGSAAYREEFDLLYRREAPHANAMWQADHSPLDILLLDESGAAAKSWLTAIQDDYSRMIVGYRLSFQKATALTTALTLRQAICRKEDPRWPAYGIPTVFYSDHGSDFTSKHMEQVAADLPMEPLSKEETCNFLEKRWRHRVKAYSDDFTDKEAIAAIVRITKGNIRLIERLMMQIEHVLVANQLQMVTKEVVETARQNLIIGPD